MSRKNAESDLEPCDISCVWCGRNHHDHIESYTHLNLSCDLKGRRKSMRQPTTRSSKPQTTLPGQTRRKRTVENEPTFGVNSRHTRSCKGGNHLTLPSNFFQCAQISGDVFFVSEAVTDEGNRVVLKWPRKNHVEQCSTDHIRLSVRISDLCARALSAFSNIIDLQGWTVKINAPDVHALNLNKDNVPPEVLVETWISGYVKWNSNSGWAVKFKHSHSMDAVCNDIVQAVSHFSYAWSKERFLICNLQGGIDERKKTIVLSHPFIITRQGQIFGCGDSGLEGMLKFLKAHRCTPFCERLPLCLPMESEFEKRSPHNPPSKVCFRAV